MSLPPGFLDELRSRVPLSRVVGRRVTWDARKSNAARGDHWAPCPFHDEKTASFHVLDAKGFYHCFGCQASGDAIKFVMETENLGFMEAVAQLADEAGMTMPARDPAAARRDARAQTLSDVMAEALRFYGTALRGGAAAAARDYLAGRGIDADTASRWDLGFAPDGWRTLFDHLAGKGIAADLIVEAGLARRSDKGGQPYDTFRNRILFPIHDRRGRPIAFGGRAMDQGESAKYINSPETPLFDKGRTLFNHHRARAAAGRGGPLILAEGYMDVIALSEAGFAAVVAPLGTAVTEAQLTEAWAMDPEPVVALDGDRAGQASAVRAMRLALPHVGPGRTLRFCHLPEGQDPDDLIRAKGAGAMQACLDAATPLVEVLWRAETEGRDIGTPERRAALDRDLRAALETIRDPATKRHYGEAVRERRWQLLRGGRSTAAPRPNSTSRAAAGALSPDRLRGAVVIALLMRYPELLPQAEAALERVALSDDEQVRTLSALLSASDPAAARAAATDALGARGLEKLEAMPHLAITPALRRHDPDLAMQCLTEELAKMSARQGAERELSEAIEDIRAGASEALTWRLAQARDALARAERSETETRSEYRLASNGVRLDKEESDALHSLLRSLDLNLGK